MNIEEMIKEVEYVEEINEEIKKACPLMNRPCLKSKCMWWMSSGHCAIAVIAVRLNALIEGVPVIRIFKDED